MVDRKAPTKILLVLTRYIGDTLLATCIARTLRQAFPDCQIDALVTQSGKLALKGNPDIDELIIVSDKPRLVEGLGLLVKYFGQYDWIVNDKPSGKSEVFALLFKHWFSKSSWSARVINSSDIGGWRASKFFVDHTVLESTDLEHRVVRNLELLSPLGVNQYAEVIAPLDNQLPLLPNAFIVVHSPSSNQIKQWPIEYWIELIKGLELYGFNIVLTGSPSIRDKTILKAIIKGLVLSEQVIDLSDQLSIAQTSSLIQKSQGYIGSDSGISHLASAHNVPIICITSVAAASMWAPWPYKMTLEEYGRNPYLNGIRRQVRKNVTVLQSVRNCVPCGGGDCRTDDEQISPCLSDIKPNDVLSSLVEAIKSR